MCMCMCVWPMPTKSPATSALSWEQISRSDVTKGPISKCARCDLHSWKLRMLFEKSLSSHLKPKNSVKWNHYEVHSIAECFMDLEAYDNAWLFINNGDRDRDRGRILFFNGITCARHCLALLAELQSLESWMMLFSYRFKFHMGKIATVTIDSQASY